MSCAGGRRCRENRDGAQCLHVCRRLYAYHRLCVFLRTFFLICRWWNESWFLVAGWSFTFFHSSNIAKFLFKVKESGVLWMERQRDGLLMWPEGQRQRGANSFAPQNVRLFLSSLLAGKYRREVQERCPLYHFGLLSRGEVVFL